jgi:hypothetical protein
MKNKLLIVIASFVILFAAIGIVMFGSWRYRKYRQTPSPMHAVVLRDRSDSDVSACSDLVAMGKELLVTSPFVANSTIAVMVTGDDSTAGEPVLLDVLDVPTSQRVMEGRSAITQRQQALLDRIKQRCEEARQTNQSPIYMAIRRAVEYLHAHGCDARNTCVVYVQSDLEELSEKSIKELLNGGSRSGRKPLTPQLPARIDNVGIAVRICGLSETTGTIRVGNRQRTLTPTHDAQRVDRIRSVWEKLFTQSDLVEFSSHCPKVEP